MRFNTKLIIINLLAIAIVLLRDGVVHAQEIDLLDTVGFWELARVVGPIAAAFIIVAIVLTWFGARAVFKNSQANLAKIKVDTYQKRKHMDINERVQNRLLEDYGSLMQERRDDKQEIKDQAKLILDLKVQNTRFEEQLKAIESRIELLDKIEQENVVLKTTAETLTAERDELKEKLQVVQADLEIALAELSRLRDVRGRDLAADGGSKTDSEEIFQ